jgi:protease I
MAKKILIVTDDSGESYEILYAVHRFQEAGFKTHIAATEKKLINGVIHDFCPGWSTYVEKPGYLIQSDLALSDVKAKDYEAVMFIGGRAPEFLRHETKAVELVKKFQDQGKWIFAICHGIQILLAAGVGAGLKLTCYANVRFELEQAGGEWVNKQCVRDGKIITAQTWESHPEFYREIFKAFAEESEPESTTGSEPDKKPAKTKSPAKKARKKK